MHRITVARHKYIESKMYQAQTNHIHLSREPKLLLVIPHPHKQDTSNFVLRMVYLRIKIFSTICTTSDMHAHIFWLFNTQEQWILASLREDTIKGCNLILFLMKEKGSAWHMGLLRGLSRQN